MGATTVKKETAKEAYATELEKIEKKLNTLGRTLKTIRGNGNLSDRIHWGHVSDLCDLNDLLEETLTIKVSRIS